jgi:hypothetical protein
MTLWAEIVPPGMAVVAVVLMEWFYPEAAIESSIEKYEPEFSKPQYFHNLKATVKDAIRTWQAIIDLVYAGFAFVTVGFTRFLEMEDKELHQGRLVLLIAELLAMLDGLLIARCLKWGPSIVAGAPINTWFGRRTWATICKFYVISSTLFLIGVIVVEHLLKSNGQH